MTPNARHNFAHGKGHIEIKALDNQAAEVMIYGVIGEDFWSDSVTAKNAVAAIDAITAGAITVRINSPGGSVADGVTIHNALRLHGAKITTRIEGQAASIAGLIAMAGDEVQCFANASLMVHAPWAYAAGNASQFREYADVLDKLASSMATSYARKTGKGSEHALALMSDGKDHFYTAEEAVAEGFVDTILGGADDAPPTAQARAQARAQMPQLADVFPDLFQRSPAGLAHLSTHPLFAAVRGATTESAMTAATPAPTTTGTPAADVKAAGDLAVQAYRQAEAARKDAVRGMFALVTSTSPALAKLEAECLADESIDALAAGKKILAAQIAEPATPTGGAPRAEAGVSDKDHFRAGMINALEHRANPARAKLDDNGKRFQGMNLVRMAEESLRINSMAAPSVPGQIATKALQSTSDFPLILENVVTKSLRAAYESTPRSFLPFTRRAVLPDFKQISRVQLGGAPSLKRVVEGGEYEHGTIGEGAEKYSVQKYGRQVAITWETIINDDLSAFTRIPEMFGRSAADLESDIVYGILIANAAMSDGVALFHATHGNLGTAGAISETTLSEAREKMLLQKGIEGRYITVRPEFLIVPPRQLTAAQKIVTAVVPDATSGVNVFQNGLSVIAEPRLQDGSATAFYLAANPSAVDTIEYGYLEGYEGVYTETKQGWDVDGVMVKCRHVFGAKAIDYRGLFRNAGA